MLIAQLSDPHIRRKGERAYGVVDTGAHLAAAVDFIAGRLPGLDALMITGDLVDFGEPEEYAHFRELIAPLRIPILPIPGNHDRRETFADAVGAWVELPRSGHLSYVRDVGPLRLAMLDSTVPGEPHGDMSAERLDWLQGVLAEAPARPAIVALHHPPFVTGIRHMDVQNCRNSERLAELLEGHPQVLAVVAGHVHRTVLTRFAGRPASIAPSPAHAVSLALEPAAPPTFHMEPPGLHLHCWTPDATLPYGRLVTHCVPIGAFSGPNPFFDAAGKLIDQPLGCGPT
ncbi:MAG: phosphodiesterase [Hyphomicrobiaceae bacterium]